MAIHNELGKKGELIAINFLKNKGYQILETNYRYRRSEIDIIASYKKELIIVEVKSRRNAFFGTPQSFVSPNQIKNIIKVANTYVLSHDIDLEVRFDIIGVIIKKDTHNIQHFKDAFNSIQS